MKKISFIFILVLASVAQAQTPTPAQSQTPATVPPAPIEEPKVVPTPAPAPAKPAEPAAVATTKASKGWGSVPSLDRPEPTSYNVRLGAGSSFGPDAFWMDGTIEIQFDKFVALGPKVQIGTSSTTDFLFGSFGPRFIIPFSYFEVGINGGFGFAYRNVAGFEFNNFLYEAGFNVDFFILQNLSVGFNYNANFLSSNAETFMSAITGSLAAHF